MCNIIFILHGRSVDMLGREGALVDAHGVGKGAGEEIIVADGNVRYDVCQCAGLFWGKMGERRYVSLVW